MRMLCECPDSKEVVYINLGQDEEKNLKPYEYYSSELFGFPLLKRIKEKEKIEQLTVEIRLNNNDDLLNVINIINESNGMDFIIDIIDNELSQKDILKILNQKLMKKDIVRIKYLTNSDSIIYNKYNEMYKELYKIIDEVKSLDLSPMEQVMYVFDIVKSKMYKDSTEDSKKSRDLDKVISSDYIVCVGYSNMMEFILKELGHDINSLTFWYDNKDVGHMRNSIYLKDDKYEIDKVLFLDATYNRKKSDDDNSYIDEYTAFLKPYICFKNSHEHFSNQHYDILNYKYCDIEEMVNNEKYIDDEESKFIILHSLRAMYNRKRYSGVEITRMICMRDNEGILEKYNEVNKLYNSHINSEIFFKCLYNVREKQVETGRIDHMPSMNEFEDIMIKNYGEYYFYSKEQLLLSLFFNHGLIPNNVRLEELYKELKHEKTLIKK